MKLRLIVLASFVAGAVMAEQQPPNMEEAMKALAAMGNAMQAAQSNKTALTVVDFRDLKALLPENLPGMKRTNAKGSKNGAMGMTVSEAEGNYEVENGEGSIDIKITDMGGTGFGGLAAAAWTMSDIDNEDDNGFERTTTIDGNKAMEKYNTKDKHGEIQTMVGGRFMVEVTGNDVKSEQIKEALKKVDLKKLAALKPKT